MKKFLSLILVFALVLSMSSVALAEAATPTDASGKVTTEEQLNDAVAKGGNIVLGGNVTLSKTLTIPAGSNVTLNLGGYALMFTTDFAGTTALIENKGTLTIEGSGKISNTANKPDTDWKPEGFPAYANNTIANSGKLIVESGIIENQSPAGGACYAIDNYAGGDVVINGGEVIGVNDCAIRQFIGSGNNVTINGGTVTGKRAVWMQLASNTNNAPNASLKVTGGTLTSNDSKNLAVYLYSFGDSVANTKIEISGGTFNGDVALYSISGLADLKNDNLKVTGGNFEGIYDYSGSGEGYENQKILFGFVSGGTFKAKPADYIIAAGKAAAKSGDKWVVADEVKITFVANGGSGEMADVTYADGAEYTLPANGFTAPAGKQFKCWSVNDEEKAVGDVITVTAATTVKAVWEDIPVVEPEEPEVPSIEVKPAQPSDDTDTETEIKVEEVKVEVADEEEYDEIIASVPVTEDEQAAIDGGAEVSVILEVEAVAPEKVDSVEEAKIEEVKSEGEVVLAYLDINLFKKVGDAEPKPITELKNDKEITISVPIPQELRSKGDSFYIVRVHDGVADRIDGNFNKDTGMFTFKTGMFSTYALVYDDSAAGNEPVAPVTKPSSGNGIKVTYMGGNSFSTTNSAVPTAVEIDGVPVSFTGDGKYFTVGCIQPGADWVTVKWHGTTVTTNFTPDVTVVCTQVGLPKTGDVSVMAYALMAVIAAAGAMLKK